MPINADQLRENIPIQLGEGSGISILHGRKPVTEVDKIRHRTETGRLIQTIGYDAAALVLQEVLGDEPFTATLAAATGETQQFYVTEAVQRLRYGSLKAFEQQLQAKATEQAELGTAILENTKTANLHPYHFRDAILEAAKDTPLEVSLKRKLGTFTDTALLPEELDKIVPTLPASTLQRLQHQVRTQYLAHATEYVIASDDMATAVDAIPGHLAAIDADAANHDTIVGTILERAKAQFPDQAGNFHQIADIQEPYRQFNSNIQKLEIAFAQCDNQIIPDLFRDGLPEGTPLDNDTLTNRTKREAFLRSLPAAQVAQLKTHVGGQLETILIDKTLLAPHRATLESGVENAVQTQIAFSSNLSQLGDIARQALVNNFGRKVKTATISRLQILTETFDTLVDEVVEKQTEGVDRLVDFIMERMESVHPAQNIISVLNEQAKNARATMDKSYQGKFAHALKSVQEAVVAKADAKAKRTGRDFRDVFRAEFREYALSQLNPKAQKKTIDVIAEGIGLIDLNDGISTFIKACEERGENPQSLENRDQFRALSNPENSKGREIKRLLDPKGTELDKLDSKISHLHVRFEEQMNRDLATQDLQIPGWDITGIPSSDWTPDEQQYFQVADAYVREKDIGLDGYRQLCNSINTYKTAKADVAVDTWKALEYMKTYNIPPVSNKAISDQVNILRNTIRTAEARAAEINQGIADPKDHVAPEPQLPMVMLGTNADGATSVLPESAALLRAYLRHPDEFLQYGKAAKSLSASDAKAIGGENASTKSIPVLTISHEAVVESARPKTETREGKTSAEWKARPRHETPQSLGFAPEVKVPTAQTNAALSYTPILETLLHTGDEVSQTKLQLTYLSVATVSEELGGDAKQRLELRHKISEAREITQSGYATDEAHAYLATLQEEYETLKGQQAEQATQLRQQIAEGELVDAALERAQKTVSLIDMEDKLDSLLSRAEREYTTQERVTLTQKTTALRLDAEKLENDDRYIYHEGSGFWRKEGVVREDRGESALAPQIQSNSIIEGFAAAFTAAQEATAIDDALQTVKAATMVEVARREAIGTYRLAEGLRPHVNEEDNDYLRPYELYQDAAAKGNPYAQYAMGRIFEEGIRESRNGEFIGYALDADENPIAPDRQRAMGYYAQAMEQDFSQDAKQAASWKYKVIGTESYFSKDENTGVQSFRVDKERGVIRLKFDTVEERNEARTFFAAQYPDATLESRKTSGNELLYIHTHQDKVLTALVNKTLKKDPPHADLPENLLPRAVREEIAQARAAEEAARQQQLETTRNLFSKEADTGVNSFRYDEERGIIRLRFDSKADMQQAREHLASYGVELHASKVKGSDNRLLYVQTNDALKAVANQVVDGMEDKSQAALPQKFLPKGGKQQEVQAEDHSFVGKVRGSKKPTPENIIKARSNSNGSLPDL